jgi:hypothetical protein
MGKTLQMIPTSGRSTDLGGCPIDCPFFRFSDQTLKMGANDASGQGLQSAVKIQKPRNINRQFPYEIYDYSIEKSHRTTGPRSDPRPDS